MPEIAQKALSIFEEDPNKFWEWVSFDFAGDREFKEKPIFLHIAPSKFAKAFIETKYDKKQYEYYAIKDCYKLAAH